MAKQNTYELWHVVRLWSGRVGEVGGTVYSQADALALAQQLNDRDLAHFGGDPNRWPYPLYTVVADADLVDLSTLIV